MPISAAIANRAINNQELDIYVRGGGMVGPVAGISAGLVIGGAILATCISVGVVKDKVWRSTKQVWCDYHQTYHTYTSHPGHLLAGLGGGLGGPIGGIVSFFVVGIPATSLSVFLKRRRLKPVDAGASQQQALAAVLRAAPALSDRNLQPAVDAMSYRDLMELERVIGAKRLTPLVLGGVRSEHSLWAWRLMSDLRETADVAALQQYLTDRSEQLSDASTQVPGFLQHLSSTTLSHLEKIRATEGEVAPVREALREILADYYCSEEGSSEVELCLDEQEITVNLERLRKHSQPLANLVECDEDDLEIDLTEEPAELQEGLCILCQILHGERLVEELGAEELLAQVYPAADKFGFETLLPRLDHKIKALLASEELNIDDLAGLTITPELERFRTNHCLQKFQPLNRPENLKKAFTWLVDHEFPAAQAEVLRRIRGQQTTQSTIEWLKFLDSFEESAVVAELQQELRERIIRDLRADEPGSLQLCTDCWNYATETEDAELREACVAFAQTTRRNVFGQLQRNSRGPIPNALYTALRRNPHYTPPDQSREGI